MPLPHVLNADEIKAVFRLYGSQEMRKISADFHSLKPAILHVCILCHVRNAVHQN